MTIKSRIDDLKTNSKKYLTLHFLGNLILWCTVIFMICGVIGTINSLNKEIASLHNDVKELEQNQTLVLLQLENEEKSVTNIKTTVVKQDKKIEDLFVKYGRKYGVNPKLLKSVAIVESGANPNAKNNGGAVGIMQIKPSTAKSVGINNVYTVEGNIEASAKYLGTLKERYNISEKRMLAIYNGGPYGANSKQAQKYAEKVQKVKSKL